ncbi:angiopoietin-related protein 1-like [Anopheles darlingi]|uniref:angiopoietin-related protein 1-like n=1 Tax=Anopheles darlingi TaxID=43151 RepID=UPI002100052C|nr:angiopoietin-related protein 1-like [Anopheles darlingi]
MKLTLCFLLLCAVLYAVATNNSSRTKDETLRAPAVDGINGFSLEQLLTKLDQIEHKLMELHPDYQKTTTTPKPKLPPFTSCRDEPSKVSGVYLIRANNDSAPFNAYCEQEKYDGGWIVVQHRFNGSVDFYRNWDEYRNGFGELDGEFWLGLERIHQLTTARKHELIVEIRDFKGKYQYIRYSAFQIGGESEAYEVKSLGSFRGTAGDGMAYSRGEKFSTKDRDNGPRTDRHYAELFEGACWYSYFGSASNLNGRYQHDDPEKSIWWIYSKRDQRRIKYTRMMIREV